MNATKIKELSMCIETLKSAHFIPNSKTEICFITNTCSNNGRYILKNVLPIVPTDTICADLNLFLRPIIDKYIQIYEDELKAHINE